MTFVKTVSLFLLISIRLNAGEMIQQRSRPSHLEVADSATKPLKNELVLNNDIPPKLVGDWMPLSIEFLKSGEVITPSKSSDFQPLVSFRSEGVLALNSCNKVRCDIEATESTLRITHCNASTRIGCFKFYAALEKAFGNPANSDFLLEYEGNYLKIIKRNEFVILLEAN